MLKQCCLSESGKKRKGENKPAVTQEPSQNTSPWKAVMLGEQGLQGHPGWAVKRQTRFCNINMGSEDSD